MLRRYGREKLLWIYFTTFFMFMPSIASLAAESGGSLASQIAASSTLLSVAEEDDDQAQSSGRSYWDDHFQLHGYLTSAYSDYEPDESAPFRSSDEIVLGLDEDGTFDYRTAALQLRFDPNPKNNFVIQLSHRRLGESPIKDAESEVELDWLFYEYKFRDHTSVKIGRVPVPLGIFNEYRDVGTLLPFFRPSFNFYREGSFVSETVDGAVFHHRFGGAADWSLDADAYYGEWDLLESGSATDSDLFEAKVSNAIGVQLWLNTPADGLRFGLGGQTYDVSESSGFNLQEATWDSWYLSIDGSFEKFIARAEYKWLEFPVDNSASPDGTATTDNYYVQLGWLPIEKLGFYVQQEFGGVEQTSSIFLNPLDFNQREDLGVAVNYSFLPSVVLKGEYHEQKFDLATGAVPIFLPDGGFKVDVLFSEFQSEYYIVSLSLSF